MTGTNIGQVRLTSSALAKVEDSFSSSERTQIDVMHLLQKATSQLTSNQIKIASSFRINLSKCVFNSETEFDIDVSNLDVNMNNEVSGESKELSTQGISTPTWTSLFLLPALQSTDVKILANHIFKNLGVKVNKSPMFISSFANADMLNSSLELNSVLGFLEKNAARISPENMIMSFEGIVDNYSAQTRLYVTDKKAYLAVFEDEHNGLNARYIYMFNREGKLIER